MLTQSCQLLVSATERVKTGKQKMDNPVWERQANETNKSWRAFKLYRDYGEGRSLSRVASELGKQANYKRTLEGWSSQYNWVERCREYDNYIDRLNRNLREADRRDEYARKIEAYREENERVGQAMVALGARAIAILQRELATRLQHPEKLKPGELVALMRASVWAVDVGSKLQAEALGLDNLASLLAETANQRN